MFDLKGKIALVTGGAQGIGLSCVQELLKNGVRAVTVVDMNVKQGNEVVQKLAQEFGEDRAIFVGADVTKDAEFEAAFKTTINKWKTIDIVVNNAGVLNDGRWELEIAINAGAVVRGTLLAFQYMGKNKGGNGGVIVNMASILGLETVPSCPVYVATKHFVVGFDRSLGTPYHYNKTGIKIVTMCPGVTDTQLVADADKNALVCLSPDMGKVLADDLGSLPAQPVENVARGVITLITKGDNGSVWVAEGNEPAYEVEIPDRTTLRKQ